MIDGFAYCQELKRALQQAGVVIHERSEALEIPRNAVRTADGRVHAEQVVACVDRELPAHDLASRSVSSVQTFLGLTPPLSQTDAHRMFPDGRCMVWDTDLIYQYFRLTADRRLVIGASSLVFTYLPRRQRHHDLVLDRM